ncbi:MAG TPA: hypothetical protein VEU33_33020 [Archangium sp.]|nr:hypothetical protein [Archangium sp.]
MKKAMLCLALLLTFGLSHSASAETMDWQRFYAMSPNIFAMQETSDGGFIAVGWASYATTGGIAVTKTNSTGAVSWEKRFGAHQNDRAYSVAQAADGGYYVFGYRCISCTQTSFTYSATLLRLDALGNQLWEKQYPPAASGNSYGKKVMVSSTGLILVGEAYNATTSSTDIRVIKADLSGTPSETYFSGGFDSDIIYDQGVLLQADGSLVLGYCTLGLASLRRDIANVVRFTPTGSRIVIAQEYYGCPYGIKQTSDGGFILAGRTVDTSTGTGRDFIWIGKANPEGVYGFAWTKKLGNALSSASNGFVTADGGYLFTGHDTAPGATDRSPMVLKTDASGNTQYQHFFGTTSNDYSEASIKVSSGGYLLGGYSYGAPSSAYAHGHLVRIR